MSGKHNEIVLKRDGQAQPLRLPAWLDPGKVPIDDRSQEELFAYLLRIAKELNFFDHLNPDASAVDGNWQQLLDLNASEVDALWAKLQSLRATQSLPAHHALLLALTNLYEHPKRLMNLLTGRHLGFYYHEVLGLKKNPPGADTVHVLFELKKNARPLLVPAGSRLLAGKDKSNQELLYELTHDIIVNNSKVEQLKSVFIDPLNQNHIHFSGVANSADGLGAELDKQNPKWNAFGSNKLPLAETGFALASDVLLMQEGERTIDVQLQVQGINAEAITNPRSLTGLFLVSATTEKGWTETRSVTPSIQGSSERAASVRFSLAFSANDDAITGYDQKIHGSDFRTTKPVLKVLINPSAFRGYQDFKSASMESASINVSVSGMTNLDVENDFGALNAKKPFFPFGPTAKTDAGFWVGSNEVFNKQLSKLQLNIEWKNIPESNLASYYAGYPSVTNSSFTVSASFEDGAGWVVKNDIENLFDAVDAKKKDADSISRRMVFSKFQRPVAILKNFQLPQLPVVVQRSAGATLMESLSQKAIQYSTYTTPANKLIVANWWVPFFEKHNAAIRKGFLHLTLNRGFMFGEYRALFTKQVLDFSKQPEGTTITPLKEPFSPEVQRLSLDYDATTGPVSFTDNSLQDFIGAPVELYHVAPFGVMREHGFARTQTRFLTSQAVKLLPQFDYEGEFLIGLSGLGADESLCLLVQVAAGSADPGLQKEELTWSVLCDNYWKALGDRDFIFDTTNDLLRSGVVKLIIPREATVSNSLLPDGLLWLRVSIKQHTRAVCQLVDVLSNAAVSVFTDNNNDPTHLAQPLPAESISKLQQPIVSIKKVLQPYASFGGRMQEDDPGFYTRVSERLRHKERSITLWDYERLVLQHFPSVYKVKCIPHATPGNYTDPGNTLIVVIPDLDNQNAINPFQPRVDKNTLDEILEFLQQHSTAWCELQVVNPLYEPVKISAGVRLKKGYEFNYYQQEVNTVLQQLLSPWINGGANDIHFGGKITESLIVKVLEDLPYVDYLTGLQLFHDPANRGRFSLREQLVEPTGPASILVSHTEHHIVQH